MNVSEVQITPIKAADGLVAFASCVIDKRLYLGSIGVHQRIDGTGYRVTYPTKKLGSRSLNYFHPISAEAGRQIEQAITAKCTQILEGRDEDHGRYNQATHAHS